MRLAINLLGSMTVLIDGQPIRLPTRRAGALLAYLALCVNQSISRERLAAYLWPESKNARGNLRAELVRLRTALGDDKGESQFFEIDRQTLCLRTDQTDIDIVQIQQILQRCAVHPHPTSKGCQFCREYLAQAVDLYHAPLLEDSFGVGSVELESALEVWRAEVENHVLHALDRLQLLLAQSGDHAQVIQYARRHLALRPWLEDPIQRLMVAHTLSNNRGEALAIYEALRDHLAVEFAEKPPASLTHLYDEIRYRQVALPTTASVASPYPGLSAFGPEDVANFFGREALVKRLAAAVSRQPLALLTGPSGSGKSSLIHAGLLPALAQQCADEAVSWSVASFRPGREPLHSLAQAIYPDVNAELATEQLSAALSQGSRSLAQVVREALAMSDTGKEGTRQRILLVADQFEEIFTLCTDEKVRRFVLNGLLDILDIDEADQTLAVLIVLRADFLGQALSYHSFSNLAPEQVLFVGRMTDRQLRRAIEEPARQNGIAYEPGLIERILADLDDSPGQLPLLQFALVLLWEAHTGHWITNRAYNDIEQVSGALTHYANGIVARLPPADQDRVRRIFLQLVQPGDSVGDTRRLASRSEIGEENWPLVYRLADSRLVVTSQDSSGRETVEVIHEALIHGWGRLREWLNEDRVFHIWQTRARLSLGIWLRQRKDRDSLLRGLTLAEAERWQQERETTIDKGLSEFIQASLQARSQSEQKEHHHRQALEAALAESQRMGQRALARQLGAQADQLMQRKCDLALLLAVEALQRSAEAQDRTDLLTTLDINPFLEKILHGHRSPVFYLGFNTDDKTLISTDERNDIQLWSLDSYTARPLLPPTSTRPDDVALDPTGKWIAAVYGRTISLWKSKTGGKIVLMPNHHTDIFRLRFTTDGNYLLSVSISGELCLWETETGIPVPNIPPLEQGTSLQVGPNAEFLAVLEDEGGSPVVGLRWCKTGALRAPLVRGHQEMIHGLALSPDGSRLATASFDGRVCLWDTATGKASAPPMTDHRGRALFAVFSPNGRWLASGGTDNQLLLWDAHSGRRLDVRPFQHGNWVRCAVFSADSSILASGDSDGNIYIWNLARCTELPGHTKRVRGVAVSPDGASLATISFDGSVGLWESGTHRAIASLRGEPDCQLMAGLFSPDGQILAAVGNRGQLFLWETATWQRRPWGKNLHNEPSIALAFSPDSQMLAQGDLDGYVSLWDVVSGEVIQPPTRLHGGLASWVLCLAFSPDGKTLTTGSKDSTIGFWTVPNLTEVGPRRIEAHTNWVTSLLYTKAGQSLISTSSDGTVRFWNPITGQQSAPPLTGHQGQVWQAQFSSNAGENVLVTLGGDGSVMQWDLQTRTPLAPPLRTGTETESMALSLDGQWLYLGSFGKKAYAWKLPPGGWAEHLSQIANRSLTAEEWKTYLGDIPYQPTGDL